MAGLLYHLPERTTATRADFEAIGLGHVFDAEPTVREINSSPSGHRGVVCCDRKRLGNHPAKYVPGEQTWHKLPLLDAWVGWFTDSPPTPADLARRDMLGGVDWELADGAKWHIPFVRCVDGDSGEWTHRLPARYTVDDTGRLIAGDIMDAYRRLWEITERPWQAMIAEEDVCDQDLLEVAGELLAANYAIHWREAALLGLFSTTHRPTDIVALAVGYFSFLRWQAAQKKSESQPGVITSATSDGEAA